MSVKKSFNVIALRGGRMDDMEYIEEFGLDPELAYTPEINYAMLDVVHKENYDFYREEGMSEKEAKKKADHNRSMAKSGIQKLLRRHTM